MKQYKVEITYDALDDLESVYDYIELHDSLDSAVYVYDQIKNVIKTLSTQPNRGAYTKESLAVGIKDYREVYFKPYRIIYTIIDDTVNVVFIVDGRRDLQRILEKRLFKP